MFPGDPAPPRDWETINTNFGGVAHSETNFLRDYEIAQQIQPRALASQGDVIVFPESVVTKLDGRDGSLLEAKDYRATFQRQNYSVWRNFTASSASSPCFDFSSLRFCQGPGGPSQPSCIPSKRSRAN